MRADEVCDVKMRRATDADIPAMSRVRMTVNENRLSDPGKVQPHHYREMLAAGEGWVYEIDGTVVGFAIPDARQGSIWALFVDPAHEGKGIGRRLHHTMVEWLFASGHERIWLTTEPNTRAERFYRAAGWQQVGTADGGEIRLELNATRFASLSRL